MTDSFALLTDLVGRELGPGDWITLSHHRIETFAQATGAKSGQFQPFHLVSLLPALLSGIDLPIAPPRLTVNYGLDRLVVVGEVQAGNRLRARVRVLGVDEIAGGLQVKRGFVVEDEEGSPVLEAETVSRLMY